MKKYCLIGEKLSHSYSKMIHKEFNYPYALIELKREQIKEFIKMREYDGFNITIPYKKEIKKYLDELDISAINAEVVNTVVKRGDKLIGYNTDYKGMEYLFNSEGIVLKNKKVLILGSGGTGVMAAALAKDMRSLNIVFVSREGENNYNNIEKHYDSEVIINTTPVGMYPNNGEQLLNLENFYNLDSVVDAIYNPLMTKLLLDAKRLNIKYACGLKMLVAQAKYARDIFIGDTIDDSIIDKIYSKLYVSAANIVLCGMPSSGKSTIGAMLAEKLKRPFIDTDKIIEQTENKSISDIFCKMGESYFRAVEAEAIRQYGKEKGQVISIGGGALMTDGVYDSLKQNGIIIYLSRDINKAERAGRPLLKDDNSIIELYNKRLPFYKKYKDIEVDNNNMPTVTIDIIMEKLYENFSN